MIPQQTPLLFSIRSYRYMATQIAGLTGFEQGRVEVNEFPDGERYQRVLDRVKERDVVLLGGAVSDPDTLELYDLANALVMQGAYSLTLIIPYYSYSTMERAVLPGEVVTAKTRARLISAIPAAPAGNRIVLLDLHTEGLPHYFEGGNLPFHLYGKKTVVQAIRRLGGDDFIMACTDAGRAKWVESLANDLGVEAAFVFKKRIDGEQVKITGVSAAVEGRRVILYDDMIRTGGSLIQAARAYKEAGAVEVAAVATHGVLPGNSLQRIKDSGLFSALVVTDSHPRVMELERGFLQIEPVAGIFADFLLNH